MNLLDKDYFADLVGSGLVVKDKNNNVSVNREELKLREEYYKQRSNAEANAYFDKIPEGVDISKVPPKYKGEVTRFSNQAIQETFYLKKKIKE